MDRLQNALWIFRYVVRSPNCCARDSISCCPAHFFKKECLIFSLISFLRVASFATGSFNSFHRSPIVGNVVSVSTLLLIFSLISVLRVPSFATCSFDPFSRSPIDGIVVSVSTLLLICFWVRVL